MYHRTITNLQLLALSEYCINEQQIKNKNIVKRFICFIAQIV